MCTGCYGLSILRVVSLSSKMTKTRGAHSGKDERVIKLLSLQSVPLIIKTGTLQAPFLNHFIISEARQYVSFIHLWLIIQ